MTLPTKLFHYSSDEINTLRCDFYDNHIYHWPQEGGMKPTGFWISVEECEDDYSWFDWCTSEQFRLQDLKYKYTVTLSPHIKILHLKSVEELLEFSHQYCAHEPGLIPGGTHSFIYKIVWSKIKAKYDGIIISPYQWKARLGTLTSWYYPWDCSSGCIWNLDKISLKLHSIIDIQSIKDREESEELVAVGSEKDSQSADQVLPT